ncbi:MAG: M20 metallopeptidase family protein [Bacteroidota bacterium]
MVESLLDLAQQGQEEYTAIRRYLHQHPELSFQEYETTEYIIHQLEALGIEVRRPLETGCIGLIRGANPDSRVIALRADIDALPIYEEGEHKAEFRSQIDGVAHCCGHDVHTTNLLAAAGMIQERIDELEGTVVLIFQPAEEKLPGGARLLRNTGILQELGVEAVFGLHTAPFLDTGTIGIKSGPLMARPDEFEITIRGKGGHAASPHLAVDPIVVAANLVEALQSVVSRSVNPTEHAVVTVGELKAGSAHNIIPETATLRGTVRTFSEDTAQLINHRLKQLTHSIAEAYGANATYEFNEGYPAVVNNEKLTGQFIDIVKSVVNPETLSVLDQPIMAGEDFAFYQQEFPGVFFFLGSGSDVADSRYSWHHPKYNVDERCMPIAVAIFTALAFQVQP